MKILKSKKTWIGFAVTTVAVIAGIAINKAFSIDQRVPKVQ